MRITALFILACTIASPAFAQQSKGITACHVDSVNQSGGIMTATGVRGCKDMRVTSTGQTGGITAGTIGEVVQGPVDRGISIPKPKTGIITLCQTGAVLDITVRPTSYLVKGGRQCAPHEPGVTIDPATNALGGINDGVVSMSFSSK